MLECWKEGSPTLDLPTFAPSNASLSLPRKIESHKEHIALPTIGQVAERAKPPGLLDRPLGLEIEREIAGPPDELQIGDRAVTMHKERHLGLEWRALRGALPPTQHFGDAL